MSRRRIASGLVLFRRIWLERIERRGTGKGRTVTLSKAELRIVLDSGKFALVSAGRNPASKADRALSDAQIVDRHKKLRATLVQDGYAFTSVEGHYGEREDSFLVMVHDADRNHVRELGERFHQDSVIFAENGQTELHFTTGPNAKGKKCHEGKGWKPMTSAKDFYTQVKHPDGSQTKFQLNLDFSKTVPCKGLVKGIRLVVFLP